MPDETYKLPEKPAYCAGSIRKLRDTDLADSYLTFNPLVEGILESVEYLNQNKAGLDEGGKVPENQLTVQGGVVAQNNAPANPKLAWIDTGYNNFLKFYDAASKTWKPVGAVWG